MSVRAHFADIYLQGMCGKMRDPGNEVATEAGYPDRLTG